MGTYNIRNVNGPANIGDNGRIEIHNGADPAVVLRLAAQLVERLRIDNPRLVPQGQIIEGELAAAGQDGLPENRGRIRSALETIGIGVAAGSGSLALVQELTRVLGL
ncbi:MULTISPECIES: hypothetical protein [Streptomyces]|uniref:Uncharacterized protein n=1 Tax=Streptomyces osmaniensis TaxID=593134 RepID=A0ABP6VAM5_9ACTN|nr:hypothetical protein KJK32_35515 [Streptomyces sp. JCM17656]